MKFGPKKGHFISIFDQFFRNFGLLIIAVIVYMITGDLQRLLENIPLLIIVLFAPVKRLIDYLFTYYEITDNQLIVRKGWLNKKVIAVPVNTITTVDFTRSILHRITNSYKIKIDNPSVINTADSDSRVELTLGEDDALLVQNILLKDKSLSTAVLENGESAAGITENQPLTADNGFGNAEKLPFGSLVYLGLLRSKLASVLQLVSMLVGVSVVIFNLLPATEEYLDKWLVSLFSDTANIIFNAALIIAAVYIIGALYNIVMAVIRYYDFRLRIKTDAIRIEYGLFTRKTYTLNKQKISGVRFQQSLLMRLFGYGSLEVFAVGYGDQADEEEESSMLYPFLAKRDLRPFLAKIIPEFAEELDYDRPSNSALPYFFISAGMILSLILLILTIVLSLLILPWLWLVGMFFVVLAIGSALLQFFNTGIYTASAHVCAISGGYSRKQVLVRIGAVESLCAKATKHKRQKGIVSLRLGVLAPLAYSQVLVKNIDASRFRKTEEWIKY